MVLLLILRALWFVAPAYAANGFPPVMQGRIPLDFGKKFRGRRIFGNGKTVEGTFGGILAGLLVGMLQVLYQSQLTYLGLGLPEMTVPLVIAISVGTMAGDTGGSFIKRQMGIKRGEPAPGMDQLGFLMAAFFFASFVYPLDLQLLILLLIITPPIHWFTNVIGYWLKFKKNPW